MSGIYIHVPFCRQACRYCDFYFTVSLKYREAYVAGVLEEMRLRASVSDQEVMASLYLGGGTPSLLSDMQLNRLLDGARQYFNITEGAELTVECNPDDLDREKLLSLKKAGVSRLSIGVQSFHTEDLQLLHRSHDAGQAEKALKDAADMGFENITADLIYGIPGQDPVRWESNLKRMFALPPVHLSAYHLSFEEGTVFEHWRKKKRIRAVSDAFSVAMFRMLRQMASSSGFEHYEISNFAREGWRSRHNQLYWSGKTYLGLGPSAHSFHGHKRSWNVASLKHYLDALGRGQLPSEEESLGPRERYHDYLLTSLRTSEGVSRAYISGELGPDFLAHFDREAQEFITKGQLRRQGEHLVIDPDIWITADHIIRELFMGD
jgi:oxygen-independent coproporphyrinogen-3 oxidase